MAADRMIGLPFIESELEHHVDPSCILRSASWWVSAAIDKEGGTTS